MSHGPGVLVLPLFIKQKKSNLSRADNNGKHSLVELSCCGTQGGKVFHTFDKMTLFSPLHFDEYLKLKSAARFSSET